MKFLCGSCRTKYQISDDKVRGKILTIRCKKCGAKVVVKESLARASNLVIAPLADEEARAEVAAPKLALGGSAASVSSASLSSAFDVAMGGGLDDMPTSIAPTPHNEAFAGVEWYVAVDGQQTGPYAYAELVKKIQTKDFLGRHYTWHDGFDNWRRIREVPDLASYLPPDPSAQPPKKKPPPPPTPPSEEDAKVVDFAQKRAEREKRAAASGPSEELTAGLAENPTARATAQPAGESGRQREEQLDSVLNAALGIQNEGQTAKAEANGSGAVTTPAAAVAKAPAVDVTSPGASALLAPAGAPLSDANFANERSSDSFIPEDLFDKVPRASAQEMVARESTRFFVAAAGVNSQKKKNRAGYVVAGGVVVALLAFFGLWYGGVIAIELPGIGNPFARNTNWVPEPELALSESEIADLRKLSEGEREARVKEIKRTRKPKVAKVDGFIEDKPGSTGSTGPRGDQIAGAGSVNLGSEVPSSFGKPGETKLPESGGPVVAAPDGALSNDVISRIVKENVGAIVDCSRRERAASLKGKVEFALTVEPDGAVSRVTVQTPAFRGTSIAACISERMKNWRFPSFSGAPQAIVVPFVFTSD